MKLTTNLTSTIVIALAMTITIAASPLFAQSGGVSSTKGSLTTKGSPSGGNPRPCQVIDRFTESFKTKLDEYLMTIADETFLNPPSVVLQELSQGDNRYLSEFAQMLATNSLAISTTLTDQVDAQIHPYLDRVSIRLCKAAVHALDQPIDPALGSISTRGMVRRALCNALQRYFARVQDRIAAVVAFEVRAKLSSMVPTIPVATAALMEPGEKRRIESELSWFVDTLTHSVTDAVDDEVGRLYDRIRIRNCN